MGYGDELLVAGHCRLLQQTDPRKVRLDFGKRLWNAVWDHNPRIAALDENGDFQTYHPRVNGLRPYCAGKTPDRWTWREYKPPVGEIYFQPAELEMAARHAPDVVIEPNLKGKASPNKDWGADRWAKLISLMRSAGIRPVQLGPIGTRRFQGADLIETPTFRSACAVLARARAAVLPEGGLHHAAAAVGVRAVVLFGGYISPAQTGYETHANIFTGGKPCGMRLACNHCARAMQKITPEMVLAELQQQLSRW